MYICSNILAITKQKKKNWTFVHNLTTDVQHEMWNLLQSNFQNLTYSYLLFETYGISRKCTSLASFSAN